MEFDLHFIILLFLSYLHCGTEASQNIALEKSAKQSSTYGTAEKYIASRAVDGDVRQVYDSPNYCTHTKIGQSEAWWQVNLGSLSDIESVKIYYRKPTIQHDSTRRLDGFQVIVSLSDNWRSETPCYNDKVGEPYPNDIVKVPCVDQGSYLTIYNNHNAPEDNNVGPILELCEVQVNGCERGRYGINCAQTCSSGCVQSSCDPDNGNCKFGCEKGWKGNKCDTACDNRKFGYSCASTCYCKNSGCNNVNGTCFSLGCQAGWTGHNCSVECSTTRFGEDCATTCHCYTGGCDKIGGRCYNQKCKPGWTSESCSTKCPLSTFGDDCNKICNCATPGCDHVDGVCDHDDGCQAGWNGTRCDISKSS